MFIILVNVIRGPKRHKPIISHPGSGDAAAASSRTQNIYVSHYVGFLSPFAVFFHPRNSNKMSRISLFDFLPVKRGKK